jgi:hypothetical protein
VDDLGRPADDKDQPARWRLTDDPFTITPAVAAARPL